MELNYNEVMLFMRKFEVDVLNRFDELIIDVKTNTYAWIGNCKDIDDVQTRVVFALCRPIGKGLDKEDANRLLRKVNKYFKVSLTREDMLLIYSKLHYLSKLGSLKSFVKKGFPMDELRGDNDE